MEAADKKSKKSSYLSEGELSEEDLFRSAVILACQNKPFSGGFDIMKKWQGEQTKRDPSGEEAYSGGTDILKQWQGQETGKGPSGEEAYSDGF